MAHAAIHATAGVAVATVAMLPPLARAWWRGRPLAAHFRNWLLTAGVLAVYAVMPALFRRAGVPEAWCRSPWMNIFLFHPWIAAARPGGGTVGPLMLAAWVIFPYSLMLAAIRRTATKDAAPRPELTPGGRGPRLRPVPSTPVDTCRFPSKPVDNHRPERPASTEDKIEGIIVDPIIATTMKRYPQNRDRQSILSRDKGFKKNRTASTQNPRQAGKRFSGKCLPIDKRASIC